MTLRYFVIKGERGEHMWTFELGTTHESASGGLIPSARVHNIDVDNLDEAIENAVSELCAYIDWAPYVEDKEAPYVYSNTPGDGLTVGINSNVYATLKETLPAAGIDLSNMRVVINNSMEDIDITSEVTVTGNPYIYELYWKTPLRVYDTYD